MAFRFPYSIEQQPPCKSPRKRGDKVTDLAKRRERVANGSRRKRDLYAVGASTSKRGGEAWQRDAAARAGLAEAAEREREAREARLRPEIENTPGSSEAWERTCAVLAASVPGSTFKLWIEPFTCLGEAGSALCLEAPSETLAWSIRRYGQLIGDAVRKATDYRGAFLFLGPDAPPEHGEDGLL